MDAPFDHTQSRQARRAFGLDRTFEMGRRLGLTSFRDPPTYETARRRAATDTCDQRSWRSFSNPRFDQCIGAARGVARVD